MTETALLPDIIHHYTNINTLALILKHEKIRLNRLDKVDDLSESRKISGIDTGNYFFVSCWTYSNKENIALWHMYANQMSGVRLSVRYRDLFKKETFKPDPNRMGPKWQGELIGSPITFNKAFNDKYFILPAFLSEKDFGRYVTYQDNLDDIFKNAIDFKVTPEGKAHFSFDKPFDVASYKERVWSFQEEIRFILFILPSIPIPEKGFFDCDFIKRLTNHLLNCFHKNIGPDIDYFDIDLSINAINNIEVTLGPLATEGDTILVKALLDKYTTNGKLHPSELTGTIRKPIK